MLRRWIWLWRYSRLPRSNCEGAIALLDRFHRYMRLLRSVSFHKAQYRARIRYPIHTKTDTVGRFVEITSQLDALIQIESQYMDGIFERFIERRIRTLDRWLVDRGGYPINEDEAVELLIEHLGALDQHLKELRTKNNVLYRFYNQALYYHLVDALEVMDALLALELRVDPDKRHVGYWRGGMAVGLTRRSQ